jgi:hypothetical protein
VTHEGIYIEIDRNKVIASLGGEAAVKSMDHEARADALEEFLSTRLETVIAERKKHGDKPYPTVAEYEGLVDTRGFRRGVGRLFVPQHSYKEPEADWSNRRVARLPKMPEKPTLIDFFNDRFNSTAHLLQSANLALKRGASEEVVLACLLHDAAQVLMKADHGWWGAQLFEPYVSERVAFAIKYHQALRFYPDLDAGYEYPDSYYQTFGIDYVPPPHVQNAYEYARNHKWYMDARLVTTNDLYSFDPNVRVSVDAFTEIIGRHFKQPEEGLGYDNTPVSHMWRTMINPDVPL